MSTTQKAMGGVGRAVDDRFGGTPFFKSAMKKVFPDHWTFLLGELALYSFVVLLLTGVYLTLFFKPSMATVVYHGSYIKLNGVPMSEAYASTLHLSFDVRGGLLVRQIHHWAALVFISSIFIHMLRHFFTGSYRKPREVNWMIGILLLVLALLEGFAGYSLPDDLLSGTGLRIAVGVLEAVPLVGSYLTFFVFGSEYPGTDFIPRLYSLHILLIPGILLALVPLHGIVLTWRVKHTQFPGKARTERNVVGYPFFPVFMAKTTALMLSTAGVIALLATLVQINPIWLYGPYDPTAVSAGAQPDWYLGFLEGALRMMPAWDVSALGHTVSLGVVIPALVVPGVLFGGLAVYPFVERWVLKDDRYHHTLDRPRNAPTRTAIGYAAVTFYGVLWAAGGNDVIAAKFHVSLYATTWAFRFLIFVAPVVAYVAARRIALGLQRRDLAVSAHGVETGIIVQGPDGSFAESTRPLSEHESAVVHSKKVFPSVATGGTDPNGVVSPGERRLLTRTRAWLNRGYHAGDLPANGHSDGGNGHGGQNGHSSAEAARHEVTASADGE
ncbi:cytochrome bc1 complex cytochrome b subunit [Actinomadura scrupuli]|uniref:cytochrome bc1 complex cytochrome b subunit n=1 Tax=Actinomadura scrupuli TaxID=559629 RepID=UPI003D958E3A